MIDFIENFSPVFKKKLDKPSNLAYNLYVCMQWGTVKLTYIT